MMVWNFCFIIGAGAALVGMGLGLAMGVAQDFTLTPVHAHINLLGFVSMMLFGLYYRGAASAGRLAWVQAGMASAGFVTMTGGLWLVLSGTSAAVGKPATMVGALLVTGSMLLFLITLLRDWRAWPASSRDPATFAADPHNPSRGPPINAAVWQNLML